MGDRWFLQLNCAYCGKLNNPQNDIEPDGVYYAPSSGATTFRCDKCNKVNKIIESFKAIKYAKTGR